MNFHEIARVLEALLGMYRFGSCVREEGEVEEECGGREVGVVETVAPLSQTISSLRPLHSVLLSQSPCVGG